MKKILLGLSTAALLVTGACTKKTVTPAPTAKTVHGYYKGTLKAPASEGGGTFKDAYLLNANGTMRYYSLGVSGQDSAAASWKGTGTWSLSGSTLTLDFMDPSSNHSYIATVTTASDFSTFSGNWKIDVVQDAYTITAVHQ
jgi:Lipocalin-like domain